MNDPLGAGDGEEFGRRPLLLIDAKNYGDGNPLLQREFQKAIPAVVRAAADAAGLAYPSWQTQAQGDALFAVLPADASEPALVDNFVRALEAGLRNFNEHRLPDKWLRLRLSVHYGPASRGDLGFVGPGPVEVARLNTSAALRAALMDTPQAHLAVGLSTAVYTDVVCGGYTTLRAEWFQDAAVAEKNYRGTIWVWVPARSAPPSAAPANGDGGNQDPDSAGSQEPEATPARSGSLPAAPSAVVHQNVLHQTFGDVEAHDTVFGLKF